MELSHLPSVLFKLHTRVRGELKGNFLLFLVNSDFFAFADHFVICVYTSTQD